MQFFSSEELSLWFICSSSSHRKGFALLCQIVDPAYFQLIPSTCPTRPQSQRAGPTLSFGAFFTALISSLARLKQCELSQLGQCRPKCPALQSLLCCPLRFRVPSFPLPFALTPLTCCSSAVVMWQRAARRSLQSGGGQCEKLRSIPSVTTVQLFSFCPHQEVFQLQLQLGRCN